MHLRVPGPSPHTDPTLPRLDAAPESPPMSAARLAAEAAFGGTRPQATGQAPSVTVRRARGVETGSAGVAAEAAVQQEQAGMTTGRDRRVFRLVSSTELGARQLVEPGRVSAGAAPPAAVATFVSSTEASTSRRNRRGPTAQRPGPVVQIFKASTDSAVAVDGAAAMRSTPTFRELAALQEALAGVQSLLEQAQGARAFSVFEGDQRSEPAS